MALKKEKFYTEEEYELFENDGLTEYINGSIIAMAPPSRIHQHLLMEISFRIRGYLTGKSCSIYPAPFDVRLELESGVKRLEPDISVICDKSKLTPKGCTGAPDFIIEIASPSYILHDYISKANWYREAGVKEYWIVNPMLQKITVYIFDKDMVGEYSFTDSVPVSLFGDFSIDFSQIDLE